MIKYIFYFLLLLLFTTGCNSPNQIVIKNKAPKLKDSISDNYNNNSYEEDFEVFNNHLRSKKQKEKTKVIYEDSIYTLGDFERKRGFDNNIQNIKIIKDSVFIMENYLLQNCNYLIIID